VTESYSQWVWGWERWEREVDWMALQGVNLVFAFNGQEYLWAQVFAELGLTQHQIQSCFNGPAWLGWSRTYEAGWQNGAIFNRDGSFNVSLHEDFLQGQHALQAKIVSREIELGIGAILPGFSGKVPGQLKLLYPNSTITGSGAAGPAWVDALDPLFSKISESFLTKATRDWGRTGFYDADGFFTNHAAPWLQSAATESLFRPADTAYVVGGTIGGCDAPAAFDQVRGQGRATSCKYGAKLAGQYIPGDASDNGKVHASMIDAQAACSADPLCGGVVSRGCNEGNTRCTAFICRSGWPSGCHAGVPCDPTSVKDTIPGWESLQNSYLVINADTCGHGPPVAPSSNTGLQGRTHAKSVYATMTSVDPEATWVYQAWPWMRSFMETPSGYPSAHGAAYMANFTSAVPKGKLVMLDMP